MKQSAIRIIIGTAIVAPILVIGQFSARPDPGAAGTGSARQISRARPGDSARLLNQEDALPAPITIDYPLDGSIFPPEITAPTLIWRDPAQDALTWQVDVEFADGTPAIHVKSPGERMRIGEIDPRCVSETNQLPQLTAQQAAARTWVPDAATWAAIKRHSTGRPARVTISGLSGQDRGRALSRGQVIIQTSKDPVGAPIFYRDVPLMPSELKKGEIKPLAPAAIPLIAWRLRNVGETNSRLLLEGMHTCANCHSFSRDGRTMGMDLDGPGNDKGLYAIAPIMPQMSIRNEDVISWSALHDATVAQTRIGFMSQVSPDGRYIVTMVRGSDEENPGGSYYVVNFKDYRFLQVFYPTRGILGWYSRATGQRRSLPGADDPRYVQTDAVWSPDGKYIVFARAEARDPYPEGLKLAERANDPDETQIQYDLYRIPFNGGQGGRAEPIAGASRNGMSNTFPKVSPDGRWVVFVQCRNGQLMRPDSQLFIVPAEGGQARRMRCNTTLMNSWHSFSPNGRWLVFSSKSRSPYTQMYLTHLDEEGSDSPAILIDGATAANRAVNIPEFVNIPPDGLLRIDVPAGEFYRVFDNALELGAKGMDEEAIAEWKKALGLDPGDAKAHNNLGVLFLQKGRLDEAIEHFRSAVDAGPEFGDAQSNLGVALLQKGKAEEAIAHLRKAVEINPAKAQIHYNLGAAFYAGGKIPEALARWREGLRIDPNNAPLLKQTAWVLATTTQASLRNGSEAVELAERASRSSGGRDPAILDALAAAYAEAGRFTEAVQTARQALTLALRQNLQPLAEGLKARMALYESGTPFRMTR